MAEGGGSKNTPGDENTNDNKTANSTQEAIDKMDDTYGLLQEQFKKLSLCKHEWILYCLVTEVQKYGTVSL